MSTVDDKVIDSIEALLIDVDKMMEIAVEGGAKEAGVDDVSCSTCTEPGCCTQSLFTFLCEVIPLARHLRTTEQDTPELREKLFEAGVRMESSSRDDFFNAAIPCVFLKDKRCTVYPYRPARCRTYFVFSDAKHCQPPGGQYVMFANYHNADRMMLQNGNKIHEYLELKETKMRMLIGSLPRVLLIALEGMDNGVRFKDHIRKQAWPTINNVREWIDKLPPRDKLIQIRARR